LEHGVAAKEVGQLTGGDEGAGADVEGVYYPTELGVLICWVSEMVPKLKRRLLDTLETFNVNVRVS
jgi:hypothetical protein